MLCKIIAKIPEILKDKAQSISSSLNQREGEKNQSCRKISIMESLYEHQVPFARSSEFFYHKIFILTIF